MVILTGKALRTVDQQMYVFFVLFFVFGRKRVAFFVFVSVSAEKNKLIFWLLLFFGRKREIHFRSVSTLRKSASFKLSTVKIR